MATSMMLGRKIQRNRCVRTAITKRESVTDHFARIQSPECDTMHEAARKRCQHHSNVRLLAFLTTATEQSALRQVRLNIAVTQKLMT